MLFPFRALIHCVDMRSNMPALDVVIFKADAIYMSGGQSGRLQSCLFGNYDQSGVDRAQTTPFLKALQDKMIVGGSSAGAMNQPTSEIMITGHSAESYTAVREGMCGICAVNCANVRVCLLFRPGVRKFTSEEPRIVRPARWRVLLNAVLACQPPKIYY